MHPAPSVILFTSFSGLGFGLLAWMGLGFPGVLGWTALAFYFVGYALAVGGLLASTFHLASPKNSIYAFSQWRTSWLSREGILAVLTLFVFAPIAIAQIFMNSNGLDWLGPIGSVLAVLTVFATSMIYTQLKTIPRWNMPINPVLFLLYALSGGALLAGQAKVAGVLILILTALQIAAWMMGDGRFAATNSTKGSAIGLGSIGEARMFESAHTARNYILDEMVHVVGRKHAQKLRMISTLLLGAIPVALLLLVPNVGHVTSLIALVSHVIGVFASRWLFFAEAEHVVGLYYTRN